MVISDAALAAKCGHHLALYHLLLHVWLDAIRNLVTNCSVQMEHRGVEISLDRTSWTGAGPCSVVVSGPWGATLRALDAVRDAAYGGYVIRSNLACFACAAAAKLIACVPALWYCHQGASPVFACSRWQPLQHTPTRCMQYLHRICFWSS